MIVARIGLAVMAVMGAAGAIAADKVFLDEKGLRAELVKEFKSKDYFTIRDDKYAVTTDFKAAKTETGGLQLRPTIFPRAHRGSYMSLFMEFDAKGVLVETRYELNYGGKGYHNIAVKQSQLKLPAKPSKEVIAVAFGVELQRQISAQKVDKVPNVRTPNFGAGIHYWVKFVAKHVWHGMKVCDHRTPR